MEGQKRVETQRSVCLRCLLVVRASTLASDSSGGTNIDTLDVGEVEVTEEVLGLLVHRDLDHIELGELGDDVVLPLTLLLLELEGDATDGSSVVCD